MFSGSCHCGRVAFEVDGELSEVKECNCSRCSRKGYLLWFVPRARFRLKSPEDQTSVYRFHKHVTDHHFCSRCGCAPLATGIGPTGDATTAVNVRCLEGVDLAAVKRVPVDGRSR